MFDNDIGKECPHADEIVSYIYGEIDPVVQSVFETHLADCMTCTDDFAAVSHSRFSVFEWNKEEFAPLATPRFVIPYATPQPARVGAMAGFFAGLRSVFAGSYLPLAASMAVIAIVVGLGLFISMNKGTNSNEIAQQPQVVQPESPKAAEPAATNIAVAEPKKALDPRVDVAALKNDNKAPNRNVQSVNAVEIKRVKKYNQLTAGSRLEAKEFQPALPKKLIKAPVLSAFDDEDDNTLRLSDLFDEGGV